MKNIELPRKVIVGDGAVDQVSNVSAVLGLGDTRNAFVVSDRQTISVAGEQVAEQLDCKVYIVEQSSEQEVARAVDELTGAKFLVSVGGGTVTDVAKLASYRMNIPFINVPTAASHDGVTSPQASLKGDKPVSVKAHCPLGVVADTEIISKAPKRLNASGAADAISNFTAVLDWQLARDEKGEYYGDYAAALSMLSAQIVMDNASTVLDDISILVEALISSGVAIGIAGSSRPCSGAEHQFSHALDLIAEDPSLHGEQCGVGSILMGYLHGTEWERIRAALDDAGAPTTARDLCVSGEEVIEALCIAHKVRDRYTILGDGLTREEAVEVAEATEVI